MLPINISSLLLYQKQFQSMEISSVSKSLRLISSFSSPIRPSLLKLGGPGIGTPCSLTSPKSPTAEIQRHRRMVMASATFSYGTRNNNTQKQKERQNDKIGLLRNEKQSHYALLGVPCDATQEDIRIAYRKLALQYHPDVVPIQQLDNATKLFSEINRAYRILSDPQERKAYDDLNMIGPKVHRGRVAGLSSSYSRTGQWRGRNWETDQCWC